jgi:hypothetical protein
MQGYFEIAGKNQWNDKCIELILYLMEQNQSGLSAVVRFQYSIWRKNVRQIKLYDVSTWSEKLNSIFQHDVDREYRGFESTEQQNHLQKIHDSYK